MLVALDFDVKNWFLMQACTFGIDKRACTFGCIRGLSGKSIVRTLWRPHLIASVRCGWRFARAYFAKQTLHFL
jgi:hypothetical protein